MVKDTYSESLLFTLLVDDIYRLQNPQPYEHKKHFLELKDRYLSHVEAWKEFHPKTQAVFTGLCLIKEEDFEKLEKRFDLNWELPRHTFEEQAINYKHLSGWNKKGKKMIIRLALQAEGIDPDKMFPPSKFSHLLSYLKKLLRVK